MHCPQCGRENPDGARFCGGCGIDLRDHDPHPYEPSLAERAPGAGDIPPRSLGQLIEATFALYERTSPSGRHVRRRSWGHGIAA